MKPTQRTLYTTTSALVLGAALLASVSAAPAASSSQRHEADWMTIANNGDSLPGTAKKFNSYNQPSVNASGLVVFRARSRGPNPASGIYLRDATRSSSQIERVADRDTLVPDPNNTVYPPTGSLATFQEFPSIPRIDAHSSLAATRGNSQPVWTYTPVGGDETRVGTTGIFTNAGGTLTTAMTQLGVVDGFGHFSVPGVQGSVRFDVFPGAPSPIWSASRDAVVAFKGNYSEWNQGVAESRTGVFFRTVDTYSPVELVANTSTIIPNLPDGVSGIPFGSTAPPSAAADKLVFVGLDDEEDPSYGGIYLAEIVSEPALTTLVGLGDVVPGIRGARLTRVGEGLSFDGRHVTFWGAWGSESRTLYLDCPTTGNADRIQYCRDFIGDDFPVEVPVHQGIFTYDLERSELHLIARTDERFLDFLYWNFSGAPPGAGQGEPDREPPRWRSSAFVAASERAGSSFWVCFKATGDSGDGIYLAKGPGRPTPQLLVGTGTPGRALDPEAPEGSIVTELGVERDGFRAGWLVISAAMLEPVSGESWAGIYLTRIRPPR